MSSFLNKPIVELAQIALTKPDDFGYWGPEVMFVTWGMTGHNLTGMDHSVIGKSNFGVISRDLFDRFPNQFRIETYKHWAAGSVDQLVCQILNEPGDVVEDNITEAFKAVIEWHKKLNDYPIADEDDYYDLQAEAIIETIRDIPSYLKDMIDEDDPFWIDKILDSLSENLNVYIDPDAEIYPKDSEILMAVYLEELWNPENIEAWEDFCSENKLEFPPKKKNPNQLNLFGE